MSPVQYLPTSELYVPALQSLADTIGTLINPNAKFNQQLRAAFFEKPELMQKFVDIEKANPGTLKAFGFGEGATNLLKGMQESIPGLQARLLAPAVAEELQSPAGKAYAGSKLATGATPGQRAEDDFSAWFSKQGKALLQENPELFIRAARAKFGTGTELENKLEDETLVSREQSKALQDMSPMEIVGRLAGGGLKMNQVAGLLVGPERAPFNAALQLYRDAKEAQLRRFVALYGRRTENLSLERAKLGAAIDAWQSSGGKGTLGGWYNHLWGEDTYGAPQAGDDAAIRQSLGDKQSDIRTKQLTTMVKALEPVFDKIRKGGSTTQQLERVDQINTILKANKSDWEAFWDERNAFARFFHGSFGPRLMFKNKAGEVTNDPSALSSEIPPAGTVNGDAILESQLTGAQKAILAQLRGLSGAQKTAAIRSIRQRAAAGGGNSSETAELIIRLSGGEQ